MADEVKWRGFEFQTKLIRSVGESLERSAIAVQRELKKQLNAPISAPGSPPAKRSGTLGRSIQIDNSKIGELTVGIGPDLNAAPYARIQEYGGTITPKNVKLLPVPLNDEARRMRRGVRSLRQIRGLKVIGRPGRLLLAKVRNGRTVPLFALRPSVTLPARPYIRPAVRAALPEIRRQMSANTILGRVKL